MLLSFRNKWYHGSGYPWRMAGVRGMDFLGIGTGELAVIVVVALIFIGPDKMVGAARTMGGLTRRLTQAGKEFSSKLEQEVDMQGQGKELRETREELSAMFREKVSLEPDAGQRPIRRGSITGGSNQAGQTK